MDTDDLKYLFAFSQIPAIGPVRFRKIKTGFSSFEEAWRASDEALIKKGKLDERTVRLIDSARAKINENLERKFRQLIADNIQIITEDHQGFPVLLREIKSSPFVLFCYGNTSLLSKKQLAVVGTRMFTPYGKMVAEKLVGDASMAGLVITSGMAQGIDSTAHRATLDLHNPTIAVLGSGINETLRRNMNRHLVKEIIKNNGLIVSEYQPDFSANKFTFPARNRIISGLSLGTLVIEADEKSGSLITANYALEQNREVFATPGNIFSQKSIGTHNLIKQGAKLVCGTNDILEALNFATIERKDEEENVEFEDEQEKKIFEKLSLDPLHVDKIAKAAKLDAVTTTTKLSMLELRGLARNIGGGRFIKN